MWAFGRQCLAILLLHAGSVCMRVCGCVCKPRACMLGLWACVVEFVLGLLRPVCLLLTPQACASSRVHCVRGCAKCCAGRQFLIHVCVMPHTLLACHAAGRLGGVVSSTTADCCAGCARLFGYEGARCVQESGSCSLCVGRLFKGVRGGRSRCHCECLRVCVWVRASQVL